MLLEPAGPRTLKLVSDEECKYIADVLRTSMAPECSMYSSDDAASIFDRPAKLMFFVERLPKPRYPMALLGLWNWEPNRLGLHPF